VSDPFDEAPFYAVADAMRTLRDRFIEELRDVEHTDYSNQLLGSLSGLATHLSKAQRMVEALRRKDRAGYEALVRAMAGRPIAAEPEA